MHAYVRVHKCVCAHIGMCIVSTMGIVGRGQCHILCLMAPPSVRGERKTQRQSTPSDPLSGSAFMDIGQMC